MISSAGADVPAALDLIKLSLFYRVDAPDDRLDELAERLRKQELIEAAYVKPPIEPAGAIHGEAAAKTFAEPQEAETPDFSDGQIYLNAAPEGIDARYAWTVPGGSGEGVNIIDIEGGWDFNHEDLNHNKGGVIGGVNLDDLDYIEHGTAVLGENIRIKHLYQIKAVAYEKMTLKSWLFNNLYRHGFKWQPFMEYESTAV